MGKINRKYLVGGAVLIVIAFILWAIVYYVDSSVTNNYHNAVDEYLNEWESSEKKEAYYEASNQYDDAKSYTANVAILIVIIGLIGFILIAISILKGEKESKGEITKEKNEQMKKGNKKK